MAREIRITIDDDEVFERLKYRKADLDLTWEEALKRGLRAGERSDDTVDETPGRPGSARRDAGAQARSRRPGGVDHGEEKHDRSGGTHDRSTGRHDPSPGDPSVGPGGANSWGEFASQLRQQIEGEVRNSLEQSMHSMHHDLDQEMRDLQDAEDAVLRFDVLEDDPRYDVPLRVRMETSRSGLDVEVVAVREGKSVTGTNQFDREARRTVNEHLATGGTATLAFGANGDAETYAVAPACSWGHDDDGSPRVTSVEIHEVIFDAQ